MKLWYFHTIKDRDEKAKDREEVADLAKKKKSVGVICPGFSSDCLETTEEVASDYKELYEEAGGTSFTYIPALNTSQQHITALSKVLSTYL